MTKLNIPKLRLFNIRLVTTCGLVNTSVLKVSPVLLSLLSLVGQSRKSPFCRFCCMCCSSMRQATRCSPSKRWRRSACCYLRWVCVCFFCGVVLLCELDSLSVCVWQVEESVLSLGKFNSMVSLAAFFPFKSAQAALENMNAISEGLCVTAAAGERRTSSAELHQLDLLRQFPFKNSPRSDLLFSDIFLRVP